MTKNELRKIYLAKRLALDEERYQYLSTQIKDVFFNSIDLTNKKAVHIFLPIESKREPNTWLIIENLRKNFSKISIIIPKIAGNEMENILFDANSTLVNSRWGIPEPEMGEIANPNSIDLVIIPLLAYDRKGHRVGYGKGFYDRFLKYCRPDCLKIGVSFFDPENDINERLEEDELLDGCITPEKYYSFNSKD
jgi:5-formyltetrahydrofolate cyclo-ligase